MANKTPPCKHCGRSFEVEHAIGWRSSREQFTCDDCYNNGKRDWATDYDSEQGF